MNIEENITIKLTDIEIKEVLKEYLGAKGYDVKNVHFNIAERGGDPMDRFPGTPTVIGIEIDAKKIVTPPVESSTVAMHKRYDH